MGIHDDIVGRLDAAISALKTEFIAAQHGLSEQVSATNDKLGNLVWVLNNKTAPAAVSACPDPQPCIDGVVDAPSAQTAAVEKRVVELQSEVALLRSQEAWLIAANQDLSERHVAIRAESKLMAKALAGAEEEMGRLRKALAEQDDTMGVLRQQVEQMQRDRENAPETVRHLSEEISSLRFDNTRLRTTIENAEAKAAARDRQQRVLLESLLSNGVARKLGELLVAAGIVTDEQVQDALRVQETTPDRMLGAILTERARVGEEEVAQAVACQCKLPLVRLSERSVGTGAARLMDRTTCCQHKCIPIQCTEDRVFLAMANPRDGAAVTAVQQTSHRKVIPLVATPSDVTSAIRSAFGPH